MESKEWRDLMRVQFYSTVSPPVFPGTEAITKDIELLMGEFGGNFLNLYPFKRYVPGFPKVFTGMHCLKKMRSMDNEADIHHVFMHHLFPLPALRILKKPVVCSVITKASPMPGLLRYYPYHVAVNSEEDGMKLHHGGFTKFRIIIPGIDTSGFSYHALQFNGKELILFCGSAPWTRSQFHKKGFNFLLELVHEMRNVRLLCLWRGILYEEFQQKIHAHGLQDRIEVINKKVDVNEVLARVHAGIVLAETPGSAAAYPRSLIESLVAGKPVISSGCMSIAEYIKRNDCGCVVEQFSYSQLKRCVETLMSRYHILAENAQKRGKSDFSREKMVESYRELYLSLL